MTAATWYLIRYMPDLLRREPRNVGIVLRVDSERWLSRFAGEKPDGSIDGRSVRPFGIRSDVYKTWVSYFRRKASDETWEDVERLRSTRVRNYFAEPGGEYVGSISSPEALLNELFSTLVDSQPAEVAAARALSPVDEFFMRIDRVLRHAEVIPQRNVEVSAKYGNELDKVPFMYAYENGQKHLMDVVTTHKNPREAARDARELRARVQGARDAGEATSFVAFYDRSLLPQNDVEHILRPVEDLSHTIDVEREDEATQAVIDLMSHHSDTD
ncbi:hypothetical protein [Amycolatopsis thermoflava]|uniref:hypothetical protein n=1 Tax=Amycolatopsis thermoflava TaxID=84480 RepID=UPI003F49B47B